MIVRLLQIRASTKNGGDRLRVAGKRYIFSSSSSLLSLSLPSSPASASASAYCYLRPHQRSYVTQTSVLFKDYPAHTLYPMPALSPTMDVGSISAWTLKEGDSFSAGDSLCTIETDKASLDFESQDDGVLAKILKQGADAVDLSIGTPICVVVEDEEDVAAFSDFTVPDDADQQQPQSPASAESTAEQVPDTSVAAPVVASTSASSGASILMPSARHLSESKGFDATVLVGSGKNGRVTKADVMQALLDGTMPTLSSQSASTTAAAVAASSPAATAPPTPTPSPSATMQPPQDLPLFDIETTGGYEDTPNNKMRKIIASRLTESKRDVPHYYTSVGVELDEILKLRKSLVQNHEVKVSVNDFVLRCCALSLRDVPQVNAIYDANNGQAQLQSNIDVSVAVATPTGLITPIVFAADKLGLEQITSTVRDLATRARDGNLAPHEYQGGTFSVSNLGMFGINEFSAVINPPQAAILAVGGGARQVIPTPYVEGQEEQSKPSIKTLMTARLSADRRVVDEATASLFLSAFRHYMNEPELLLL